MDTNIYLCGWTALMLWHRVRCARQPRLDQTDTALQELRRLGMRTSSTCLSRGTLAGCSDMRERMGERLDVLLGRLSRSAENMSYGRRSGDRSIPVRPTPASSDPIPDDLPVDLLVTSAADRTERQGVRCRVWGGLIPPGAFVALGNGVFLSTPEFAFLQLAPRISLPLLILLGFEVCGFFAVQRAGCLSQKRCQPLTTASRLRRFLDAVPGTYGSKRARTAVRYILDHAGSIMEAAMVELTCLSRVRGGYGLPFPQMNPRIEVPSVKRELLGRSWISCDAYWPGARVALEYDGRIDHEGANNVARDYARANDLVALGIAADFVTKEILFNVHSFDKVVRKVARQIGYQLNPRDFGNAWHRRRAALRDEVVGFVRGGGAGS